ncbi:MAG: signal peptidase I [Clostridiales bacterium]|nr:signal peptidase I [Clostridiales bacterium]
MRRAASWWAWILGAVVVGLIVRDQVFGTARVIGSSMEPTLYNTDIVLLTRFDYWFSGPSRGDVALCLLPGREQTYLKRVAAVPGDSYAIRGGVAYLNGEALREAYATGTERCEDFQITLDEGEYLVLGDNRLESYDSRAADVGVLSRRDFIGRVRFQLWPIEKFFRGIY